MRTGSFGRTAINVKLEKVTNDIADVKKGKPMTFAEADTGNVNPHYMSRLMSWFDDKNRLGTIKIMNLSDCFLNKSVVDFVLEERK